MHRHVRQDYRISGFTRYEVVAQPRVARKLTLVALDCGHPHAELTRSFTTPTTRFSVRLYGPRELQQVAHAIIRLVNPRISCSVHDQSLQLAEVFICKQRLLFPQTRKVKSIRTHAPNR